MEVRRTEGDDRVKGLWGLVSGNWFLAWSQGFCQRGSLETRTQRTSG